MSAGGRRGLPGAAIPFARGANALFFLLTATYCILTYSSFAYQQFIRPRLVSSLSGFVTFHHLWHWVFLGITVATLLPEWRSSRGRVVAWTYVAAMAGVGLFILYKPVLPAVENDGLGLWLACGFLVPPIWLALYDHLATAKTFAPSPADTVRIAVSAAAASLFVWVVNVATAPLRFSDLGDYTTTRAALIFGAVVSLAVHVGLFTIAGVALALLLGVAHSGRRPATVQYWLIVSVSFVGALVIMKTLVFESLSFTGAPAWLVAAECAAAITMTWSAAARRVAASRSSSITASEAWFAPVPGAGSIPGALAALALVAIGEFFLLRRIETFDWNFLVQNLCVVGSWVLTGALVHAMVRRRALTPDGRPFAVAALAVVAVAGVGAGGTIETRLPGSQQFVPEFVLDAYATVDPSYRLMRQFLSAEPAGAREFFGYLGANSLIQHIDVKPVDVDFVRPLSPAPGRAPHIFLFVIDSLRRDYLAPYNPLRNEKLGLRLVDMVNSMMLTTSVREHIDAAIHCDELNWGRSWISHPIGAVEWGLCSRADHPLSATASERDVLRYPFIFPALLGPQGFRSGDDNCPVPMKGRLRHSEVSTSEIGLHLARNSDQLIFLPKIQCRNWVRQGLLRMIEVKGWPPIRKNVFLTVHQDKMNQRVVKMMVKSLEAGLK